jgi:Holliday junction DNA helicase RuvA
MSLTSLARLGAEGSEVAVLVHTHVTQDAIRLFAFADSAERQAFNVLIGTTGVGPKLALAVLSALGPEELVDVVLRGDRGALTRIPGIGAKTADRLLLELKHRLPDRLAASTAAPGRGGVAGDLAAALVGLGFKPAHADEVARQALEQNPAERDLATLVRHALRATTQR